MLAVTTFSAEGYKEYAKAFLESYVKYWPMKLVVFYEERPDFNHPLIEYRNFYDIPETDILEKIGRTAHTPNDYRFNAYKFSRKVFAQNALFDETDKLFWIDADCICLSEMKEGFLENLLKEVPFCYLGRQNYTETGFLGFNTQHPDFGKFRSRYVTQYTEGRIFRQKEWHDCIAFDVARAGIKGKSLTKGGPMEHVFISSPLAPYLDHLKGLKRKKLGYSPGHPYLDKSGSMPVLVDGQRSADKT